MDGHAHLKRNSQIAPLLVVAVIAFAFANVLFKLGRDWWSDENYSHGLLVPFVIGFFIWSERGRMMRSVTEPGKIVGGGIVLLSIILLFVGTVGAELYTQRIAFVAVLVGTVIYFFGRQIMIPLAIPFALLLLAIPIPQIVFNRIAFPLQIWASQIAIWGIRLFEVPTLRKGNVIDILPRGATQTISLEVVEACSGIRSLMTLITLALILSYFTRTDDGELRFGLFSGRDLLRTVILMAAAVPIAVLTNAARVSATGISTYYYGKQATESAWHEASGWLVYVVALALLIGVNFLLKHLFGRELNDSRVQTTTPILTSKAAPILPLLIVLIVGGALVNWFANRSELSPARTPLTNLSKTLGDWRQKGDEIMFNKDVETVLKTTDYTMREYMLPDGRIANLYVGYYASQRTGATYHSPQNCLPGAGWVMSDPQTVDISMSDGRTFKANRYIIKNGIYNEVMIYWYQGRGRTEASEYTDKLNTVFDSVSRRRSDGAMVRIMTSVGDDESAALSAASDLSAKLAEQLSPFVPE